MSVLNNSGEMPVLNDDGLRYLWGRIKQLVENLVGGRKIPGRKYLSVSQ